MRHDESYRSLFEHPEMVEDLCRHFIHEPFIAALDFARMEVANSRLHSEGLERRDGDLIYRIPRRDGGDVYLCLFLEFQSTPDFFMAVRMHVYVGLFFQHLLRTKQTTPSGLLPPVFPVVLYNGQRPWKGPVRVSGCIDLPPGSALWAWQPEMSYHLVEERLYPPELLRSLDSTVALLFELENCDNRGAAMEVLKTRLLDWVGKPGNESLKRTFALWVQHYIAAAQGPRLSEREKENLSLSEVKSMLSENVTRWEQELREEGLREGVLSSIEIALKGKFGQAGKALMDDMASIKEVTNLREMLNLIISAATIEDVRAALPRNSCPRW